MSASWPECEVAQIDFREVMGCQEITVYFAWRYDNELYRYRRLIPEHEWRQRPASFWTWIAEMLWLF